MASVCLDVMLQQGSRFIAQKRVWQLGSSGKHSFRFTAREIICKELGDPELPMYFPSTGSKIFVPRSGLHAVSLVVATLGWQSFALPHLCRHGQG